MAEKRSEQDERLSNEKFEGLKASSAPLGQDALKNSYWYFGGHKLYIEPPSEGEQQPNPSEGSVEEEGNWDVACQNLKQWEGLLRKLKRSSISEEKKLATVVQEQIFPKAKGILETMASAQVEEEVETLPKRRPSKKKPKAKPLKMDEGDEERKSPAKKVKKERPNQRKKSEIDDEAVSLDEELGSPGSGKKAVVKRRPTEKEKSDGRGSGGLAKKNKTSISSDDCEALKTAKSDNDDESFEPEERPLEITDNPRTEGTRTSGRRAARNCMMRQRQALQLTEDPSSDEEEVTRNRKRSRRDSDDDFSDEQSRKKKRSGTKRRASSDRPVVPPYQMKMPPKPQPPEERKIFMFSTNLANVAADAVEKHLVTSIIAYHCQHPSATGLLCDVPIAPSYSRRPGVVEPHPGQYMGDPRMSNYSRPPMAPPTWDMSRMFASKPPGVHAAVSTWQPPPFGTSSHNNGSRERLHPPQSQIPYHPMHHPSGPFSQSPSGYPSPGGYRPLSHHPPSHHIYSAFPGHMPPGVPPSQQPMNHPTQSGPPEYSVDDLTQMLVGGTAGAAAAAGARPPSYSQSDFYRAQRYEQQSQMAGQAEQVSSPYAMSSGPYPYQSVPTGYPTRTPDIHGHVGREHYFQAHPGIPRGHDISMYQGAVRDMSATDYHQQWAMHRPAAPLPSQQQQEPVPRQNEMYNDRLQQQHPGYTQMSSPTVHPPNWLPPPPYSHQQRVEGESSGTSHDSSYQPRPGSSSNPPALGTPTTPNAPHDSHHTWQAARGGAGLSDVLSHRLPPQQSDQHQETGRASSRSSVSGYSQADATGASTLLEMSSSVPKTGQHAPHPPSMAVFSGFPPSGDHGAGHMVPGQDPKYMHPPSSQPGVRSSSDPLTVLASLTDKQPPLPQAGLMQTQEKVDDRHDIKGSSEGESNGSVGSSKRASSFSIENLAAPHRKDMSGMEPGMMSAFPASAAPATFSGPLSGSPFPGVNSVPHPGYLPPPGWGAGNPGFQHPAQNAFHMLGSQYGAMANEMNHRQSESGGPQQRASLVAESQGDTSQRQDS